MYAVPVAALPSVPARIIRTSSPTSSPARQAPARRPPRAKSRPKKIDVRELEEKFKELQQLRKKDESEQRDQERQRRREDVNHHQTLLRQQRLAERDVVRREQEVDRLENGLNKVRKETRVKNAKQTNAVSKIDDTLRRLEGRQQELEQQLEEKVEEAAIAKGRLAHIEFANTLLTQGQVALPLGGEIEDTLESSGHQRPPTGTLCVLPLNEREHQLHIQAEELRILNRRRAEENERLRRQLEELRSMDPSFHSKPLLSCHGGDLGNGSFFNLFDEGLTQSLGPGFSFSATIRYDKFKQNSRIFDFGNCDGEDNIYVGNHQETSTLVFAVYQGSSGSVLTINDFWPLGEARDYLFIVSPGGHMKVFCDGLLVGGKQGHPARITERRNLYVGRSNSPSDAAFEGEVRDIKVWSCEVEWSRTQPERPSKVSAAESWAGGHRPPPGLATSCTYPSGVTLHFPEFAELLAPLLEANHVHRKRILEEIESGNHTQIAMEVYQSHGWDLEGHLEWRSGDVCQFIRLVFQELSLVPPNEAQVYDLYAKFAMGWSNHLSALNCLYLVDAVLRVVFYAEVASLGGNALESEQAQSARVSWSGSMPNASVQPEASGQPTASGASTLRTQPPGSYEVPSSGTLWSPQRVESAASYEVPTSRPVWQAAVESRAASYEAPPLPVTESRTASYEAPPLVPPGSSDGPSSGSLRSPQHVESCAARYEVPTSQPVRQAAVESRAASYEVPPRSVIEAPPLVPTGSYEVPSSRPLWSPQRVESRAARYEVPTSQPVRQGVESRAASYKAPPRPVILSRSASYEAPPRLVVESRAARYEAPQQATFDVWKQAPRMESRVAPSLIAETIARPYTAPSPGLVVETIARPYVAPSLVMETCARPYVDRGTDAVPGGFVRLGRSSSARALTSNAATGYSLQQTGYISPVLSQTGYMSSGLSQPRSATSPPRSVTSQARSRTPSPRPGQVLGVRRAASAQGALPFSVAGVDVNHDGRSNFLYVGVDQNRDGIPDALQVKPWRVIGSTAI